MPMLLALTSGAAFRHNAELTALSFFFVRNWTADVHKYEHYITGKMSGAPLEKRK